MSIEKQQQELNELDNVYTAQKTTFEKWKIDNSRQLGTPSYESYVQSFKQWEQNIIERKKALTLSLRSSNGLVAAGPQNVDSMLGELLEELKPTEFIMACITVNMKDATFMNAVLENYHKLKNGQLETQPTLVMPQPQFIPSAVVAPAQYYYPNVQPAALANSTPQWANKPYRPPSPVRDYKNPTASIPFRDFSQ